MYELIKADERHIDQLVPLLASTGYWDFGMKHNALNVSNREFMREGIVKPHLPFTHIMVKKGESETVLGVIVCASKEALSKMAASKYNASLDPRIVVIFKNILNFELTESYHVSFLAVKKEFRGKGLGKKLLEYAEKKGHSEGCETLSLYTVNCQSSAISLYLRFGMMLTKVITISDRVPFPHFLYFEKNKKLMTQHDYFDTEEFQKLDVINLSDEKN
ncbi:MAG: GNAT family N-acetyltransferase [Tatlockia sp.]|nr:GNAT family N-acetyltransferase [Tatlockia sp.]